MSESGTQCFTRSQPFLVEWPLTSKTDLKSQSLKKHVQKATGIKKRKIKKQKRLGSSQTGLLFTQAMTTDPKTQTDDNGKSSLCEVQKEGDQIEHSNKQTSVGGAIYEPAVSHNEQPNIFESLDRDEAVWLAEEVHQANSHVIETERAAEKLKNNTELEDKKSSLDALQKLLKDLRWNIKYPDEETAKDLDTLNEASRSFGVRNMVNYLSLLDGYFSELQRELDKQ